jgi:transmembrane sensor
MPHEPLAYYIDRLAQGSITADEWMVLQDLLRQQEHSEPLAEILDRQLIVLAIDPIEYPDVVERIQSGVAQDIAREKLGPAPTAHRVRFLKTAWVRFAAAVIILFGIGAYLWNTQQRKTPASTAEASAKVVKNDILPGSDRAVLTLSTGQQVILDSAASETIKDGTLSIKNNNGQLIYKQGDRVAMNTMSTPKGGQYQLTLADGTKVWLNAASSITYPTAFTGTLREVSITGEAYFEVTRNPKQPFVVKTPKEAITVLGTSFNVNAYADEPAMKTSLLEGSVKVGNAVLRPGQAYVNGKVVATNLDQDVAWKNGVFNFEGMELKAAFRLLGRWYNVDIKYAAEVPAKKIRGGMGHDLTLLEVLESLRDVGINMQIEGNTLVVLPE